MSIEDYAEGIRTAVTAIACEAHRPVSTDEGCPWCEIERLQDTLSRHGFRRCDIPACNCGGWHQVDGLAARWRELEEVLEPRNGQLMLDRAKEVVAQLAAAERQLMEARELMQDIEHAPACLLYAHRRCDCGVDALERALAEPRQESRRERR